jgi:hypothetical protein
LRATCKGIAPAGEVRQRGLVQPVQDIAAQADNADAKRKMRRVAVSYKKLAQRLEHEAGGADKT